MMKFVVLFLLATDVVLAAGGSYEQGPISSLLLPALNFSAVVIFLFVMLRKPMRSMFEKKATDVVQLYYHAEEKEKEAKIKLSMYQEKMANLEAEKAKILKQAEEEVTSFSKRTEDETRQLLVKVDEEAKAKIEYELTMLKKELNASLLDEVINKAKSTVAKDSSLNKTITQKLASEVRS